MSRLHPTFGCGNCTCAATLDTAPGTTGLLLVSGGNEIRSGAFSGQALLAAQIASAGFPVFRYDRRGIGDSDGQNRGYLESGPDIAAALAAFRVMVPQLIRVVGFGNCDAASALMLNGGAGLDALVLSNPWTIDQTTNDALPPAAVRSRYVTKLKDPRELARLISGGVHLGKLARGIGQALRPKAAPSSLAQEMANGLTQFDGPVRILLAGADRTAHMFEANWDVNDTRIARCGRAGHSYAEPHAREWLLKRLLESLDG